MTTRDDDEPELYEAHNPHGDPPDVFVMSSARGVELWNRGALAGTLILKPGNDAAEVCMRLGMINASQRKRYEADAEAVLAAAKRWRAEHPSVKLAFQWSLSGVVVIDALAPNIEAIACNNASIDFLRALDAAVDGRATVLMAQAAYELSS